jgi:Sec-independent protein secretion pathway component TatC
MKSCPSCHQELPDISRFCTRCGHPVDAPVSARPSPSPSGIKREDLNINVLYAMVAALVLALLFPPWETPASQTPEFLGLHFILSPPNPEAVVSRLLLTIELTTLAIAGLYLAFLLRSKN